METLGNRIKAARKLRKWSQARLAEACGWEAPSRVGNYEQGTREPALGDIKSMANSLRVAETWLLTGSLNPGDGGSYRVINGVLTIEQTSPGSSKLTSIVGKATSESNVSPTIIRGRVPVIHRVRAGDFTEIVDIYQTGDADEWVDATCPVNAHTFALIVEGDSMEPEFHEGMRIVVEPDMTPENGDYVVAGNGESANLKKLVRVGADWYLKPLNDAYQTKLLGDTPIIGVVREAHRKYR